MAPNAASESASVPVSTPAASSTPTPKKKSSLVIILVIVLVLLCCCGSLVAFVWWGIKNGSIKGNFDIDGLLSPTPTEEVTQTPTSSVTGTATATVQSASDVVRSFFAALDSGDKASVQKLSDPVVFNALYKVYDDGTIAEMFRNNVESVTILREETVSAGVIVYYELQVTRNAELLEKWNRADIRKPDSSGAQVVQFVGPDE